MLLCPLAGTAQDRGLAVIAQKVTENSSFNVGKQFALIIGIDRYQEWYPLNNAVGEARKVKEVLAKRYYIDEFIELYDQEATAAGIRRILTKELPAKLGKNDSLFVFYAGHGYLDASNTGSWIAVDGTRDELSQNGWITNQNLRNMLVLLPAQRILVVVDACFSGDMLNTSRGSPPTVDSAFLKKALQLTARQVLSSGASETVPDASEFGAQLVDLLERNTEQVLDSYTMYDRVRRGVTLSQPLFGTIPGSDPGAAFALFLRSGAGSLHIRSDREAEVAVDGYAVGSVGPAAPLLLSDQAAGEHRISYLFPDGSREDRTVTLSPASTLEVTTSVPGASATASVRVASMPVNVRSIEASRGSPVVQRTSATEATISGLPTGTPVALTFFGSSRDRAVTLPVTPGGSSTLEVKVPGGRLLFPWLPKGHRLLIDGEEALPLLDPEDRPSDPSDSLLTLPLLPATYRLTLEWEGKTLGPIAVTAAAGKTVVADGFSALVTAELQAQREILQKRYAKVSRSRAAGLRWIALGALSSTAAGASWYLGSKAYKNYTEATNSQAVDSARGWVEFYGKALPVSGSIAGLSFLMGALSLGNSPDRGGLEAAIEELDRQLKELGAREARP